MCKVNEFTNLKFDYKWQHDLLTKLDFIKSANPKHVIFEKSCKLYHIPYLATTNCLWLPSITLFRCSSIVWTHQCAHDVLNNLHASRFGYMSWISFPNDILIELSTNILLPNHHPIWHLLACPPNILQTSKLWHDVWLIIKGNL
jgi:hypothetical protein